MSGNCKVTIEDVTGLISVVKVMFEVLWWHAIEDKTNKHWQIMLVK